MEQATTNEEKRVIIASHAKLSNILTENSVEKFNLSRARIAPKSILKSLWSYPNIPSFLLWF
jgi:hypothetical protein